MQILQRQTIWGNKILGIVDEEVERLVNNSYLIAKRVLDNNRDLLEHLTKVLMEQEVVSAEEFQMMLVEFQAKTIDCAVLGEE
jgi:cell division protease FtsH